eukprot:11962068-Alexandrium_andersonii.AAC.1
MSASLVGSEMCIRDSPPDPLEKHLQRTQESYLTGSLGQSPPLRKRGKPCLLYTSDAADDM